MTRARSLFYVFFDDNDRWHVTAVGLLSWMRPLRPSMDVNKHVHCVRACQFTTGPPHTMEDCKLGGLKRPACAIIMNKLLTHGPLRAFCCSQCSTHVRISKIDNGETKTRTRINFDNRLSFNIPTSDARKCKHFKIYHFYNVSIKHVNSTINSSSNFTAQFQHWSLFSIMVCLIVTGWWSAPLRQSYCLLQT